jgi:hypothetical protein
MLVVYSNDEEILITEKEIENELVREWFVKGLRDLEDYDRTETVEVIQIHSRLRLG